MISYYTMYRKRAGEGPPVALFVLRERGQQAILWSHRSQAWQRNPELVLGVLQNPQNWDRLRQVDRAEAERAAVVVTAAAEYLPDEATLRWLLREGSPA